ARDYGGTGAYSETSSSGQSWVASPAAHVARRPPPTTGAASTGAPPRQGTPPHSARRCAAESVETRCPTPGPSAGAPASRARREGTRLVGGGRRRDPHLGAGDRGGEPARVLRGDDGIGRVVDEEDRPGGDRPHDLDRTSTSQRHAVQVLRAPEERAEEQPRDS